MRLTLTKKYLIAGFLGLFCIAAVFTMGNIFSQKKYLQEQTLEEAENIITNLEVSVAEEVDALRIDRLRQHIQFLYLNDEIQGCYIYDEKGMLITDGNIAGEHKHTFSEDFQLVNSLSPGTILSRFMDDNLTLFMPIDGSSM